MNLPMSLAPNANLRRRAAPPAATSNMATVYTRGGRVLRVPLRPAPARAAAGCVGHPERQLMLWLRRRSAAEPGFPLRIRSVLLIVRYGGCPQCQEALGRFLNRFRLGTKLRLVRTGGGCACGCGHCQGHGSQPRRLLDELLQEDNPANGTPTAPASTPNPVPLVPDKHCGPEFRKSKADLKRGSIDDPDLPSHVRGWMKQERNQRGSNARRWRNPPGMDVGHIDPTNNKRVRWEESGQNRSRGARFKREISAGVLKGPNDYGRDEKVYAELTVINKEIDVYAQRVLMRMLNSTDPAVQGDAVLLLNAIEQGVVKGIYQEDQQVPALFALKTSRGWWQLFSPDTNAHALVLMESSASVPPVFLPHIVVFRRQIRTSTLLLETALRRAANAVRLIEAVHIARPELRAGQAGALVAGTTLAPGTIDTHAIIRLRRKTE